MHLRLGCCTRVLGKVGRGAAEDYAEVLVEVCEELVLVGGWGPGGDIGAEGGNGAAVEEIDGCGVLEEVLALLSFFLLRGE